MAHFGRIQANYDNPEVVDSLFPPQKQLILRELMKEERTIYYLKVSLNLNPGIIKRHIDDLIEKKLVLQTRIGINDMGMNLKFYRAVAKRFIVHLEWPIQ